MNIFNPNQIPEIEAVDAQAGSGQKVLLDVREADEWEAGHAPGRGVDPARRPRTRPYGDPVQQVHRVRLPVGRAQSARAAEELISWGFEAANMTGGMRAWAAAGLPVVRDDETPGVVI